jgi:hypothetical protein
VVVAQWNRNSRKESAVQQCESQVQAGKQLELTERVGLEIARRFAQDTNRSGPARQGSRLRPHARAQVPIIFLAWGRRGERRSRVILVNHTQLPSCKALQRISLLGLQCVFMPDGFDVAVLFQHSASQAMCETWPRTLEVLPATFHNARLFVQTVILASHGHDKERLVANSNTPPDPGKNGKHTRLHRTTLVILQAAQRVCGDQPIICVTGPPASWSLGTLEESRPLGHAEVWTVAGVERQPHDRGLGRRPHKLSIAAVWLLTALETKGGRGRGKKRPLPPEEKRHQRKLAMSQLQSSIPREQALKWIR